MILKEIQKCVSFFRFKPKYPCFYALFSYFCEKLEYQPEMLQELETQFSEIEKKIQNLQKSYQNLSERFSELNTEHNELKMKYDEERKRNQVLAEEQKNIKLYSAISGNPEHNRLMKNHINRLVKEVDFCIAQLQNSGL